MTIKDENLEMNLAKKILTVVLPHAKSRVSLSLSHDTTALDKYG